MKTRHTFLPKVRFQPSTAYFTRSEVRPSESQIERSRFYFFKVSTRKSSFTVIGQGRAVVSFLSRRLWFKLMQFVWDLWWMKWKYPSFTTATRSGHVGFVVDDISVRQAYSEYFDFLCQLSFHQLLFPRLSSWGLVGHLVVDVPNRFLTINWKTYCTISQDILPPFSIIAVITWRATLISNYSHWTLFAFV
jgi:hypothetical protein